MAADRNTGRGARRPSARRMTNRRMFLTMLFGAVFRRRSRAVMAVVASMVGATTLFCLAAICLAVPQRMGEEMRSYGANLIVTGQAADDGAAGMDGDTVAAVEQEVEAVGDARHAAYRYETVRINSAPYVLAGIDVDEVQVLNRHWSVDGDWPSAGQVMVGGDVADAMGLRIGSTVTIGYHSDGSSADDGTGADGDGGSGDIVADSAVGSGDTADGDGGSTGAETAGDVLSTGSADAETAGDVPSAGSDTVGGQMRDGRVSTDILENDGVAYRVAGILDTGGNEDGIIYAIADDVAALAGDRGPDVIEFSSDADGDRLGELVDAINDGPLAVGAQQVSKMTASNQRIVAMLQTLFWLVSVVVLALTLVGVSTTMSSIVSQRRNEIGLRKALGAPSSSVVAEFAVESALYGLIGGLVGTGIGYALARALCVTVFERTLAFSWPLGAFAVALSMAIAVVASVPPIRRATRIDPAVVLREE